MVCATRMRSLSASGKGFPPHVWTQPRRRALPSRYQGTEIVLYSPGFIPQKKSSGRRSALVREGGFRTTGRGAVARPPNAKASATDRFNALPSTLSPAALWGGIYGREAQRPAPSTAPSLASWVPLLWAMLLSMALTSDFAGHRECSK